MALASVQRRDALQVKVTMALGGIASLACPLRVVPSLRRLHCPTASALRIASP